MEYKIQKAILHILGNDGMPPVYSQKELDLSEEAINNFIIMHAKKIYNDDASKNGFFDKNSFLLSQLPNLNTSFIESSLSIADHLNSIMKTYSEIAKADLLISLILIDETPHAAIIKFNYKEGYTHSVDYNDSGAYNKIMVHKVIFASLNQKSDEGAIINLKDFSLRITEKPYNLDGKKELYFSKLFLECKTDLSRKESIKVINEVAKDITTRYYNNDFQKISEVKAVIHDNIEVDGSIKMDTLAESCFEGNHVVQEEYLEKVRQAGVTNKIQFSGDSPERKFSKQKIKTDNGIELSMPIDIYKNKDIVEFNTNKDGTISIILKNINSIISR